MLSRKIKKRDLIHQHMMQFRTSNKRNMSTLSLFLATICDIVFVVWNIELTLIGWCDRPRVNPMLARGIGRINVYAYTRVYTRDSTNERSSESVHPLGEPRRRHYAVYLAFNLINESRSASVVAVHRPLSLSIFLRVSRSTTALFSRPEPPDFPRSGERMERRPAADGRESPLNVYLRPRVALFVREIRGERAGEAGSWLSGQRRRRQEACSYA